MRGGKLFLALAVALYAAGLWTAAGTGGLSTISWGRYPVFLPTGLLGLMLVNQGLRSHVLAWGLFTISFVCFMAVLGALVIGVRTGPGTPWAPFLRALGMYAALCMAGLYQLRGARSQTSV